MPEEEYSEWCWLRHVHLSWTRDPLYHIGNDHDLRPTTRSCPRGGIRSTVQPCEREGAAATAHCCGHCGITNAAALHAEPVVIAGQLGVHHERCLSRARAANIHIAIGLLGSSCGYAPWHHVTTNGQHRRTWIEHLAQCQRIGHFLQPHDTRTGNDPFRTTPIQQQAPSPQLIAIGDERSLTEAQ